MPFISADQRFHLLFQRFRPETMMAAAPVDELRQGCRNSENAPADACSAYS
jgi:hypothetical protein